MLNLNKAGPLPGDRSLSLREMPRHVAADRRYLSHRRDARGFVVSPALLPDSFTECVDRVLPELQRLGVFRRSDTASTLRDHLQS